MLRRKQLLVHGSRILQAWSAASAARSASMSSSRNSGAHASTCDGDEDGEGQGAACSPQKLWTPPVDIVDPLLRETLAILQALARAARATTPFVLLSQAVEEMQVRPLLRRRHGRTAERALANLDQFLEAARAYDTRGLRAFARTMTTQWKEAQRTMEGRPDTEQQSVSLVTIHASKGLEWPVVVPINMGGRPGGSVDAGLDADGRLHLRVFGLDRVDLAAGTLVFESLKKRRSGIYRAVPPALFETLDMVHGIREQQGKRAKGRGTPLWPRSRMTRWRVVHAAELDGPHASPKGLRHGFGVAAFSAGIPLNLVQKWLGHAQLSTTAIHADAVGVEEQDIASRMWK
ncbi:MAG: tyrosine-type recombinase/integrase [Janthinobacterium lividum]